VVAAGLQLSRDNYSLERASRTAALCGQEAEATQLLRELAERFPNATLTSRVSIPITHATLAWHRNDSKRVIDLLEPVAAYDRAARAEFWPEYLRGQAYLRQRNGRAAAASFQTILDHRGEFPSSSLYPLARLGLARAQALSGDTPNARQSYEAFFSSWAGADASLEPVAEARRELARLN
jgi:TolA-binding protein